MDKLEFLDFVTRNGPDGTPRVVTKWRVTTGPYSGREAYCWRNVDRLIGKARYRGRFFAKDPRKFGQKAKYNTEWHKFAPISEKHVRRDRMSPIVFKGEEVYGTLHLTKGEMRITDLYCRGEVEAKSIECPVVADSMSHQCPRDDQNEDNYDVKSLGKRTSATPQDDRENSSLKAITKLPMISGDETTKTPKNQSTNKTINHNNISPINITSEEWIADYENALKRKDAID